MEITVKTIAQAMRVANELINGDDTCKRKIYSGYLAIVNATTMEILVKIYIDNIHGEDY
jgi:hypothetical protein